MKLPAEYTWNRRMPSPRIWPPKIRLTLNSTPACFSDSASRSYTWRTAWPSTRQASNMLVAFQMVIGFALRRFLQLLDLQDLAHRLRDAQVARRQQHHEAVARRS
jgi:hypothetical protein